MSPSTAFRTANPHALACILETAETRSVMAATDIFDAQGIKLWARDQPVTADLQRRLADRRLREPLETSLRVEDGVTGDTLADALQRLSGDDGPLCGLLRPHAARLMAEARQLPLEPAAQLLLSVAQSSRAAAFEHALRTMALCATLAADAGGDRPEIRAALLAGLLHDLGEIYLSPRHGEDQAEREQDFVSYQQLVVHPHVGSLILRQLTGYPGSVAEAVAEHHERLDGSGYPRALTRAQISPLGRLLAVSQAVVHALRDPHATLLHASVALRAVPGEFDEAWIGRISRAAREAGSTEAVMETAELDARRAALDALLSHNESRARMLAQETAPGTLHEAAELACHLLARIRTGWNESGLWADGPTLSAQAAELEAVEDELYRRLRGVQRVTRLRAGALDAADACRLQDFCDQLAMDGG